MFKRHPRYGTPLPPGRRRYLLPEVHLPHSRTQLRAALRQRRVQGRLALGLVGLIVLALVFSFISAPPPPPQIGQVNAGQSQFGPVIVNAPIGWGVQIGSEDLDTPWVLYAPQNDPKAAPITITLTSVDVTDRLRLLDETLSSSAPSGSATPINARILLDTLTRQYLARVAHGPFCTLDTSYGSQIGTTGVLSPSLLVEWQKPIPWGSKLVDGAASPLGQSKNTGACPPFVPSVTPNPAAVGSSTPTASSSPAASGALGPDFILAAAKATHKPTPKPKPSPSPSPSPSLTASPTAAASLSPTPSSPSPAASGSPKSSSAPTPVPSGGLIANGPLMHQIEWFALPTWAGLRTNDTQRMLVITLSYPESTSADLTTQAQYVFAQLLATINGQ